MLYLDEDEIAAFVDGLDKHQDGFIYYQDLRQALDKTYQDLQRARLRRTSSCPSDGHPPENLAWHERSLLCSLLGFPPGGGPSACSPLAAAAAAAAAPHRTASGNGIGGRRKRQTRVPRAEFVARVRAWRIPSLRGHESNSNSNSNSGSDLKDGGMAPKGSGGNELDHYVRSMSRWRRVRSYWAVHGPQVTFVATVVGLQMAFSLWISVRYANKYRHDETFSWGTVVSKACAGALLPSLVFLILSMSRYVLCSSVCICYFLPAASMVVLRHIWLDLFQYYPSVQAQD